MPLPPTAMEPAPGESPKAFQAFLCYQKLGATNELHRVAKAMQVELPAMERWNCHQPSTIIHQPSSRFPLTSDLCLLISLRQTIHHQLSTINELEFSLVLTLEYVERNASFLLTRFPISGNFLASTGMAGLCSVDRRKHSRGEWK